MKAKISKMIILLPSKIDEWWNSYVAYGVKFEGSEEVTDILIFNELGSDFVKIILVVPPLSEKDLNNLL